MRRRIILEDYAARGLMDGMDLRKPEQSGTATRRRFAMMTAEVGEASRPRSRPLRGLTKTMRKHTGRFLRRVLPVGLRATRWAGDPYGDGTIDSVDYVGFFFAGMSGPFRCNGDDRMDQGDFPFFQASFGD